MTCINNYFDEAEITCHCGCGFKKFSPKLLRILNQLRETMYIPLYLNSACRCAKHNKVVGGAVKSLHLVGKAADISLVGMTKLNREVLLKLIRETPEITGIGIGKWFIHIDIGHGERCEWGY